MSLTPSGALLYRLAGGVLLFATSIEAATLKVDQRGQTPGAYTTLAEAALDVRAGDTLLLVPGSGPYREMLDIKQFGTRDAPIVIEGSGELITGFEPFTFDWNASAGRWEFVLPAPIGNQANGTVNGFRHLVTYRGQRLLQERTGGGFTNDFATLSTDGLMLILGTANPAEGWEIGTRSLGVRIAGLNTEEAPVAWHHVYRNLRVSGARNDGFNLHGTGTNLHFENIEAFHNFDEGFSAHDSIHCSINGGAFWGNDNGLYNQSSRSISMRVNHVRAYANLGVGISMRQGSTEIRNSQAWDNGVLNIALGGTVVSDSVSTYRNRWPEPPFLAYQEAQGQLIGQSYPYAYEPYWQGLSADMEHQAYTLTGTAPAVLPVSKLPPFALAYDDWRFLFFAADQIADPETSSRTSDPDGDGRMNQDEYRLGTDPLFADGVAVITSVTVPDAAARASDQDSATIVLRRSGNLDSPLTVYFTMGGSAVADTDYRALGNFVEIPAGAPSADLSVVPLDRGAFGTPRLAQLSLVADGAYIVGPASGTVVIDPLDLPVITLSVLDASASEAKGEDALFRIRRSGSTDDSLAVHFQISGTATPDEDYPGFGDLITFAAGSDAVDLRVVAVIDRRHEVNETVGVTLLEQPEYTLANAFGSITIEGLPLPTLTLAVTDASATESPSNTGAFTLTRSSGDSELEVFFTLAGTATPGADYASPGTSALIPAGASYVTVVIQPVDDGLAESSESVTMTLSSADTYVRGSPLSGTVTIANFTLPTMSVTTIDPSASEAPGNTGIFSIRRTGPRTSALLVRYAVTGSATPDADFAGLSGVVEIAVGSGASTVDVVPYADTLAEGNEIVQLTLSADAEYVFGTTVTGTVTIKDVPPPTVSLVVNDGAASEAGGNTGLITVRRTGSSAQALSIALAFTGTAVRGEDYENPGLSLLIPVGFNSVTVTIQPLADLLDEGSESVVLSLVAAPEYALGDLTTGTVNIADVTSATVSLAVIDSTASESGSDSAAFRISRGGITSAPLSVSFSLGGSAGTADYAPVSSPVEIAAGTSSVIVTIAPVDDAQSEDAETVTLALLADGAYLLASPTSGSITIYDAAPPTVTLTVTDAQASEAPGDGGEFLLSRSGPVDAVMQVEVMISGTASNGVDYAFLGSPVLIPAGAATVAIAISPIADNQSEGAESVTLALVPSADYVPGISTSGTVTIGNTTAPTVTLIVNDSSASENPGNDGLISVWRTGSRVAPLMVTLSVSGTATPGADYGALPQQLEIAAGSGVATLAITALTDLLVEGTETVDITIAADSRYVLGSPFTGTVKIVDVPPPTLTLTVNGSAASEAPGNGGLISIARNGSRTTALAVSFSMSGTATAGLDYEDPGTSAVIAAGSGAVTIALTPLADALDEGPETAIFTLSDSADYQLGANSSGTVNIADVFAP